MDNPKITIQYSCFLCGLKDVPVEVKERSQDQDLMDWMNDVGILLSGDHNVKSPNCRPKQLSNIKIPISGRDKVGGPVVQ
jgi:hypothetical protein